MTEGYDTIRHDTGSLADLMAKVALGAHRAAEDDAWTISLHRAPLAVAQVKAVNLPDLTDGFWVEWIIGERIDIYETVRALSARTGRPPAKTYYLGRPVDMMDKPDGIFTSPPAQ